MTASLHEWMNWIIYSDKVIGFLFTEYRLLNKHLSAAHYCPSEEKLSLSDTPWISGFCP